MKALILAAVLVLGLAAAATAQGQEVCPEGDGWVKADNLSGLTYTFEVAEGFVVTDNCYKAGNSVVFGEGKTVTSGVFNSPQGVTCTDVGVPHNGCNYLELSHASFLIKEIETPDEPEEREVEETEETEVTQETIETFVDNTPINGK